MNYFVYTVTKTKLTRTVAPFSISIIVACYGAPMPFVVLSSTPVITAAFVDEREHAAVTRRRSLSATPWYKETETNKTNQSMTIASFL